MQAAVCEALVDRLCADRPRDQVRVCADFKLLGGDRIVLAWACMPQAESVFPSTDFPASMHAHADIPEGKHPTAAASAPPPKRGGVPAAAVLPSSPTPSAPPLQTFSSSRGELFPVNMQLLRASPRRAARLQRGRNRPLVLPAAAAVEAMAVARCR